MEFGCGNPDVSIDLTATARQELRPQEFYDVEQNKSRRVSR